jgi:transcription antitermination factor NusB
MSSEKATKNSGTRHKARECALQMLFAVDLVEPARLDVGQYWAEVGLEELHHGITATVWTFIEDLAKISRHVEDLRSLLRRLEPLEKNTSRLEKLKRIINLTERADRNYRTYITALELNQPYAKSDAMGVLDEIRAAFGSFSEDFQKSVELRRVEALREDLNEYRTALQQSLDTLDRLRTTVDQVDEVATALEPTRKFADRLALGTLENLKAVDDRIRTRAEHWRIERMAIVDRNVLRLAVYEFLYQDTPNTVVINEALEIARRFSTFEATQFINGILDAVKHDLEREENGPGPDTAEKSQASSN